MEVILNKCYGGFGVSEKCYDLYAEKLGKKVFRYIDDGIQSYDCAFPLWPKKKVTLEEACNSFHVDHFFKDFGDKFESYNGHPCWDDDCYIYLSREHRENSVLIECIKELGEDANGLYAELKVVEIPDNMEYEIDEYDGIETLHQAVPKW